MRKNSHIDIARYIKDNSYLKCELDKHKLSLYFGSILPDIVPTFIYKRHTMDSTLQIVKKEIEKILRHSEVDRYYCRHLGIISHYISDYCTLPHNKEYIGNLKQHCIYEKELKDKLKDKLKEKIKGQIETGVAVLNGSITDNYIMDTIIKKHNEYLRNLKDRAYNIENDCKYIIGINITVAELIESLLYNYSNEKIMSVMIA